MKLPAIAFLCISSVAFGCAGMPKHLARNHESLVKEATAILLVEAISDKKPNSGHFKVIRALKGNPNAGLNCAFRPPSNGDWMSTLNGHSDPSFWEHCAGRIGIEGDCTPIPPAFELGHQYLIFIGVKPDTKQFEEIAAPDDKWLLFVEQTLNQHAK